MQSVLLHLKHDLCSFCCLKYPYRFCLVRNVCGHTFQIHTESCKEIYLSQVLRANLLDKLSYEIELIAWLPQRQWNNMRYIDKIGTKPQPHTPMRKLCAWLLGCTLSWWRHQIEKKYRVTGPLCHQWTVNSPHKGQWRGALVFSLIWAWTNGWVNHRDAGYLKRHRSHYDATVMLPIRYRILATTLVVELSKET